jgi:hypothetical protein
MQTSEINWTEVEQEVAQQAFKTANFREINSLIQYSAQKIAEIKNIEDLWQLNDFLNARRHDIAGKYEYQLSSLIFIFADLLKEGWLSIDDLAGLGSEKLTKISLLSRM